MYAKIQINTNNQNIWDKITPKRDDNMTRNFNRTEQP